MTPAMLIWKTACRSWTPSLVAARHLAALLTETWAPGTDGIVTVVALQQRNSGELLDDVIVDFWIARGRSARSVCNARKSAEI